MDEVAVAAPDDIEAAADLRASVPSRRRGRVRFLRLVVIAVLGLAASSPLAMWVAAPQFFAPRALHIWGHIYSADGWGWYGATGQDRPWANPAISLTEVEGRDASPTIVEQTSGPFLIGLKLVELPKPPKPAPTIYLKIGEDAYVLYRLESCCEPRW